MKKITLKRIIRNNYYIDNKQNALSETQTQPETQEPQHQHQPPHPPSSEHQPESQPQNLKKPINRRKGYQAAAPDIESQNLYKKDNAQKNFGTKNPTLHSTGAIRKYRPRQRNYNAPKPVGPPKKTSDLLKIIPVIGDFFSIGKEAERQIIFPEYHWESGRNAILPGFNLPGEKTMWQNNSPSNKNKQNHENKPGRNLDKPGQNLEDLIKANSRNHEDWLLNLASQTKKPVQAIPTEPKASNPNPSPNPSQTQPQTAKKDNGKSSPTQQQPQHHPKPQSQAKSKTQPQAQAQPKSQPQPHPQPRLFDDTYPSHLEPTAFPQPRCKRVILIVLDGAGVGELPDAAKYGDKGSATIPNVARAVDGLSLPFMGYLGLGNIVPIQGVPPVESPAAHHGKMATRSAGKDTTIGHWELAGLIIPHPFPTYPHGFPDEILDKFMHTIGRPIIGNKAASGTAIIEELGKPHMNTGFPIVYTSADSVFQIAAHEDIVSRELLYSWCYEARQILKGAHSVGRVIARPFRGEPGSFMRTDGRRDFSLPPLRPTMLDLLSSDGVEVTLVGKINDIFTGRGTTKYIPAKGDNKAIAAGLDEAVNTVETGLIWANFNDFDTVYGHRNDARGFAYALEDFDNYLKGLVARLKGQDDYIMITADHGCDPTSPGTDHTREYVPILAFSCKNIEAREKISKSGTNLQTRTTLSDVGATILHLLGVENSGDISGSSFIK